MNVPAAPLIELRPDAWASFFDYQRAAVAKAVTRRNLSLWHACGAGKTAVACAWAVASSAPVLVVTRGSVRDQWAFDELPRYLVGVEPFVLQPKGDRKVGDEPLIDYLRRVRRPFVVMGWSGLIDPSMRDEIEPLLHARPSIVWDEVHALKAFRHTKASARADGGKDFHDLDTTAAWAARIAPRASRRLGLTATPIYNTRSDLWAQFNAVEPGCVGRSPWPWLQEFCGAYPSEFGWFTAGATNDAKLLDFLGPRVHVVTAAQVWAGLPPCEHRLTVVKREDQDAEDDVARAAVFAALKATAKVKASSAKGVAAFNALRQAQFCAAASRKRSPIVRRAVEVLTAATSHGKPPKMLIFTGTRREVDILGDALRRALPQTNVYAACGDTPTREREVIRRAYMDDDTQPQCIVGTGYAWGESSSLQKTDVQLIVAMPWTWGMIRQWLGRARRKRQDRPLIAEFMFAEGTADDRVFPRICAKLASAGDLIPDAQIDLVRSTLAGGTDEELIDDLLAEFR